MHPHNWFEQRYRILSSPNTLRETGEPTSLQVEVNMRNTPEKRFWNFVLNSVRVNGIIDFLLLVKVFVTGEVCETTVGPRLPGRVFTDPLLLNHHKTDWLA